MYVLTRSVACVTARAAIARSALISTTSPVSIRNRSARCETTSGVNSFRDGAQIYLLAETAGNRCGSDALFPRSAAGDGRSVKNYHFWSEAYLGYLLARKGFSEKESVAAAIRPAELYKKSIQKIGAVYQLYIGVPAYSGTVADVKSVLAEQRAGAEFGYRAFGRMSAVE